MANNSDIIEGLGIQITSSTSGATKSLNTLNKGLERLIGNLISVQSKSAGTVIGNVGTQAQKTSTATTNATKSFNLFNNSMKGSRTGVKSLTSAFGHLYANFFLVIRGIKSIGKAIESSMDYVETYNYFNVTMDKIGKEWNKDYKKWGYDNAETYENSFQSRIEVLNKKMTGYQLGNQGEATYTGEKNLGLDIEAMMNYQASIGAVTNSLGLMGETSVNVQKAMSMLSADLSSFKNIDLSSVMTNLQSGLIGQSRSLYKYGIDITNATLQTLAYELGLSKTVTEMTQAEKLQLRVLAILQQSRIAWGDQANTLNSVANQYRILKQQFSNLSRTIGNLFLPVVKMVLPVVNGLVIAMNQLLQTFGISLWGENWLSDIMTGTSAGYTDDTLGNLADDSEDLSSGLEDSSKNAKKLKNNLIGIDKLNIISPQEDSATDSDGKGNGSGIDLSKQIASAVSDYEKVWEEAFKKSENLAQKYAKKIVGAFESGNWGNLGRYISSKLSTTLRGINWNGIYDKAGNFGKGLAEFFNGLISEDTFKSVGSSIAKALNSAINFAFNLLETFDFAELGDSIASLINQFFEDFDFKKFAGTLNKWANGIYTTLWKIISGIDWGTLLGGIFDFLTSLQPQTAVLLLASSRFKKFGASLGLFGKQSKGVEKIKKSFSGFSKQLSSYTTISSKATFATGKISEKIDSLTNNLSNTQMALIAVAAGFIEFNVIKDTMQNIVKGEESIASGLLKIIPVAVAAGAAMTIAFGPAGWVIAGVVALVATVSGLASALDDLANERAIQNFVDASSPKLSQLKSDFDEVAKSISKPAEKLSDELSELEATNETIEETVDEIKQIGYAMDAGAISVEEASKKINGAMDTLLNNLISKSELTTSTMVALLYEHEDELEAQGVVVEDWAKDLYGDQAEYSDTLTQLFKDLEKYAVGSDEYNKILKKIFKTAGIVDTATKEANSALINFDNTMSSINFEDYIVDGEIDTELLKQAMNGFVQTYNDAKEQITKSYDEFIAEIEASNQFDEETKKELIEQIGLWKQADLDKLEQGLQNNLFIPLQNFLGTSFDNMMSGANNPFEKRQTYTRWAENIYNPLYDAIASAFGDPGDFSNIFSDQLYDEIQIAIQSYPNDGLFNWLTSWFTAENNDRYFDYIRNQFVDSAERSDFVGVVGETITNMFGAIEFSGIQTNISNGIQGAVDGAVDNVETTEAKKEMQTLFDALFTEVGDVKVGFKATFDNVEKAVGQIGQNINVMFRPQKVKAYAAGGFPEDGWFRASKGEYFGQFDDGTSYIANNSQIEVGVAKGVEEAAYRGMLRALSQIKQNGEQTIIVQSILDGKKIAESTNRHNARMGHRPIGYGSGY